MSLVLPPYEEPDATTGNVPWPPDGFSWTGTGGITDIQSYAWVLHNAIYKRLSTSTFFAGFTIRRISEALPIEAGFQIPFLGVYEGDEVMGPEGGANQGEIRFTHTLNLGVQVVVQDNDPTTCLQRLDQAYWFVMNRLWRDDTFTNRLHTLLPDNVRFEAVPRIRKRTKWGVSASRNETPVGILALDFQLLFKTDWYPTEFTNLDMITVTTVYPSVDDADAVQQIKAVYVFPQAKGETNGQQSSAPGGPESGASAAQAGSDEEDQ